LHSLQEPALSAVEGVAGDAADRKFCSSRKHPEHSSLVIPNRAESAMRNLLSTQPTQHAHALVVPTLRKVREEWGTHRVIGTTKTKAWTTRQRSAPETS
jgi:hypothetical protein